MLILEKDKWIWHKRAGHISMKTIAQLSQLDLVRGLPKISFGKDKICEACVKGKQVKSSFKTIQIYFNSETFRASSH